MLQTPHARGETTNGCFGREAKLAEQLAKDNVHHHQLSSRERDGVTKHRLLDSKLGQVTETRGTALPGYPEQTSQYQLLASKL